MFGFSYKISPLTIFKAYAKIMLERSQTNMNDYLVEYKILAKFIDDLIAKKYPHQPAAELESIRSQSIRQLDDEITNSLLGGLTESQVAEFNALLDNQATTTDNYQDFFRKNGINVEQVIAKTMQDFTSKFLGGDNERL